MWGASDALPVLITMLRKVGLKEGLVVADEIWGNVKCALKVHHETKLTALSAQQDEQKEETRVDECEHCGHGSEQHGTLWRNTGGEWKNACRAPACLCMNYKPALTS